MCFGILSSVHEWISTRSRDKQNVDRWFGLTIFCDRPSSGLDQWNSYAISDLQSYLCFKRYTASVFQRAMSTAFCLARAYTILDHVSLKVSDLSIIMSMTRSDSRIDVEWTTYYGLVPHLAKMQDMMDILYGRLVAYLTATQIKSLACVWPHNFAAASSVAESLRDRDLEDKESRFSFYTTLPPLAVRQCKPRNLPWAWLVMMIIGNANADYRYVACVASYMVTKVRSQCRNNGGTCWWNHDQWTNVKRWWLRKNPYPQTVFSCSVPDMLFMYCSFVGALV